MSQLIAEKGDIVLKWAVPVDGQVHQIGDGRVVHVGCQRADQVSVWTLETSRSVAPHRSVTVVATGESLPEAGEHLGSTIGQPFVWHLFAVRDGIAAQDGLW